MFARFLFSSINIYLISCPISVFFASFPCFWYPFFFSFSSSLSSSCFHGHICHITFFASLSSLFSVSFFNNLSFYSFFYRIIFYPWVITICFMFILAHHSFPRFFLHSHSSLIFSICQTLLLLKCDFYPESQLGIDTDCCNLICLNAYAGFTDVRRPPHNHIGKRKTDDFLHAASLLCAPLLLLSRKQWLLQVPFNLYDYCMHCVPGQFA